MNCRLLTDPGGGWLEIGFADFPPRAVPALATTGNHKMSDRHVYVDDEVMGETFAKQFDARITDHVHYPARCPVRDYLPFSSDLLEHGFIGAQATLRDGRHGEVMAIAQVTFEGAQQPEDCLILSLYERDHGPAILPVPMAKAGFHVASLRATPDPAAEPDPEPTRGPRI